LPAFLADFGNGKLFDKVGIPILLLNQRFEMKTFPDLFLLIHHTCALSYFFLHFRYKNIIYEKDITA